MLVKDILEQTLHNHPEIRRIRRLGTPSQIDVVGQARKRIRTMIRTNKLQPDDHVSMGHIYLRYFVITFRLVKALSLQEIKQRQAQARRKKSAKSADTT